MEQPARRGQRYPFFAAAEVVEIATQSKLNARTSDLGGFGCYMDMLNPYPFGTPVTIRITYNEVVFNAAGRVIYSQPNMGMGVSFDAVEPRDKTILENWLKELQQENRCVLPSWLTIPDSGEDDAFCGSRATELRNSQARFSIDDSVNYFRYRSVDTCLCL